MVLTYTVRRDACSIGRSPESDLVLPEASVSARHAELRTDGAATLLTDLDSSNGTFVDGVRLLPQQPRALEHGQTITIGPFDLAFRSTASDAKPAARPPAEAPALVEAPGPVEAPAPADASPVAADPPVMASPMAAVAEPFEAHQERQEDEVRQPRENSRYMRYLPAIFHDDDFLSRFLQMFEVVWEPLEQRQDHVDVYFSAMTCPADWLPWMASWFGIALEDHWPEARKRALLDRAIDIYRWRGTAYGLERVIEACVGARPEIATTPENPFVFRVTIQAPSGADGHLEQDVHDLISAHKPAHTGYTLEILR